MLVLLWVLVNDLSSRIVLPVPRAIAVCGRQLKKILRFSLIEGCCNVVDKEIFFLHFSGQQSQVLRTAKGIIVVAKHFNWECNFQGVSDKKVGWCLVRVPTICAIGCAKSTFFLLIVQILGAQMRTLSTQLHRPWFTQTLCTYSKAGYNTIFYSKDFGLLVFLKGFENTYNTVLIIFILFTNIHYTTEMI